MAQKREPTGEHGREPPRQTRERYTGYSWLPFSVGEGRNDDWRAASDSPGCKVKPEKGSRGTGPGLAGAELVTKRHGTLLQSWERQASPRPAHLSSGLRCSTP